MVEPDLSYEEFPCVECDGKSVEINDEETVTEAVIRHYRSEHDMLE